MSPSSAGSDAIINPKNMLVTASARKNIEKDAVRIIRMSRSWDRLRLIDLSGLYPRGSVCIQSKGITDWTMIHSIAANGGIVLATRAEYYLAKPPRPALTAIIPYNPVPLLFVTSRHPAIFDLYQAILDIQDRDDIFSNLITMV